MNQLETEFKYSKRMASMIILDSLIDDVPFGTFKYIMNAVDNLKGGLYYPQKQALVSKLPDTEFIAYEIFIAILSNFQPRAIQGVAIQLGKALGYKDLIESCKIGCSLLSATDCALFDILLKEDGVDIVPKLKLDPQSRKQLEALCYMPPLVKVPEWKCNTGGWIWERKSVILGQGNHHNREQNLSVLNKVQKIAWKIDGRVLRDETNPNKAMDKAKFCEIAGNYENKEFYFAWRYDKRGRMYSSGYDLNVQSNEYGKALLSPIKREYLTEDGRLGLLTAIAGHAGFDKLTWRERQLWALNTDLTEVKWKEPILGRKAMRAYHDSPYDPQCYMMQLDATSSFAQIMSVLSGCKQSAKLCNLIHTGKRENLYYTVSNAMNDRLSGDNKLLSKKVKKAVMTHYYNSKANPKKTFNDDQLAVFYEVLEGLLPGCEDVMNIINQFWNPNTLAHTWTMPDGHVCHVLVTEMDELRITIEELDDRRVTLRYNKNMPSKNYRSLCPNIIHSIDGYINREMIRRADFQLASIHDCWLFHPNYFEKVKQLYRDIMAEIADSHMLADILSEISGKDIQIEKDSTDLSYNILQSEYMLS